MKCYSSQATVTMWEQQLISLDVGSCIASFISMTDGNYSLLGSSKTKKSSFMKTITSFVRPAVLTLKHTSLNDRPPGKRVQQEMNCAVLIDQHSQILMDR